jgi:hypothetical protein
MAQIDTLTNVGAVVSTDLALILRGGANVLGTFGSLVGQNATSVVITGGTINATTIGGVTAAAGSFTTVTASGEITANGGIALGDNDVATFGASDDLQIFHDGGNSRIYDQGTGALVVRSNQLNIQSPTGEKLALFNQDSDVELYYDDSLKLATTATGIDVTGTATMDGLTISSSNAALLLMETDTTDVNSRLVVGGGQLYVQTTNDADTLRTTRLLIDNSTGDISFYDDAGAAKMVWDASAESLEIGSGVSATPQGLIVNTANSVYASTTNAGATLQLSDTSAGAGQGNFGPSIWFGGTNQPRALVGIRAKQTGTDSEHMGLSFFTHPGASAGDLAVEQMVLNSNGNVGIGVTPDTWSLSAQGIIDLGAYGSVNSSSTLGTTLSFNAYYNSGWKAKNATAAMLYLQDSASHQWFTSGAVSADAAITDFSAPKMKLDASGNLLVGKTNASDTVAGGKISSSGTSHRCI